MSAMKGVGQMAAVGVLQDHADVIVCGGGLAGYCASIAALEAGKTVVLLEKLHATGGSTVLSGGAVAFAGTAEQKAAGIADSVELLLRDLREMGAHRNDESLLAAYGRMQLDTYEWLKRQGVAFTSVQLGGGQSVPRSNRVDTRQMINALDARARQFESFTLHCGARAERIFLQADGQIHLQVRLDSHPGPLLLNATSGLVLATGGFSRSEEWMAVFAPNQVRALRIGGAGNTGDGLRMGMALGANLRDMGYVRGTFGIHPSAGPEDRILIHAFYKGAIAVNREGRRFVDESVSYKISGDACLQQPDCLAFQIFDQPIMDLSVTNVTTSDFRGALESGHLIQAGTLAELANRIEVDAETLSATVATYNRDVEQGRDTLFGRTGLGNGYGRLRKIETAPFYAYPSTSAVLATYAGLQIDDQACVLNVFGNPLPGIYAAGEVTGGFHGEAYMTGSSLGKSAVFGRIAGMSAAARV